MAALGPIQDELAAELCRMKEEACMAMFESDTCCDYEWRIHAHTAVLACGHHSHSQPALAKVIGVVNPYLSHFVPPSSALTGVINQRFFDFRFSLGKPYGFPAFEEAFDDQARILKAIMMSLDIPEQPLKLSGVVGDRSALEKGGSINFAHTILVESYNPIPTSDGVLWDVVKSCPARDCATRFSLETAVSLGTHELRALEVIDRQGDYVAPPDVRKVLNNALVEVDFILHYHATCGFRASPVKVRVLVDSVMPGVTMPGLTD
ncbi:hypothetical protein VNI00_014918 [Paramarasmius palmivorus]|uniref:Uncharacterized protein n=1 Tax=Paramarasmius palmivorus TaxID=297713 RepID=A0AAW0BPG1_9AGAR